jgi:hypothetical protein
MRISRLAQTLGIMSCIALVPLPVTADLIEDAKAAVLDRLKDPESARFTDIKVQPDIVCGWVNAKTSEGGYAGKRRWMYTLQGKKVVIDYDGGPSISIPDTLVLRLKEDTCK